MKKNATWSSGNLFSVPWPAEKKKTNFFSSSHWALRYRYIRKLCNLVDRGQAPIRRTRIFIAVIGIPDVTSSSLYLFFFSLYFYFAIQDKMLNKSFNNETIIFNRKKKIKSLIFTTIAVILLSNRWHINL